MRIKRVYASTVAKLNSNVYLGGGDDDTLALQAVLDEAKDENIGIHLIMDGAAYVKQLKLWSNTTIECLTKDCGFYQKSQQNQALITNAERDCYRLKTKNITLIGGTYNQNGENQAHDDPRITFHLARDKNNEFNRFPVKCIEFYGVEQLLVRDVIIRDFRTYAFMLGGFRNATIENVWLDLPNGTRENQDGFHFWGPGQFLNVLHCGGKVGDDIINVGPDERDKKSSITDVLIDGIMVDEGEQAVRLLSRGSGILDRITIRNVTGKYRSYGFYINPWFEDDTLGSFKNIFIENVDLQALTNTYDYRPPFLFSIGGNVECITLRNIRHHNSVDHRPVVELGLPFYSTCSDNYDDFTMDARQRLQNVVIDGLMITEKEGEPEDTDYITIYDKVDNLILKNVIMIKEQKENGTLLYIGKKGAIENLVISELYTKGLKQITNDGSKIRNKKGVPDEKD